MPDTRRSGVIAAAMALVLVAFACQTARSDKLDLPDGSQLDLTGVCPVCNMKATTNPLGPAAAVFKDGKVVGFDGARHLFIFVLDPKAHSIDPAHITGLYVTQYGTKAFIDAKKAFFVMDSDVKGNMGSEVVPFPTMEAADKFKTDHNGKRVATFGEIQFDDVKEKKAKMKMQH